MSFPLPPDPVCTPPTSKEDDTVSEAPTPLCGQLVCWWNGEYEDNCELPEGHDGDHWDGLSWFNDDNECTDSDHAAT
jgi:hypothetical protein